MKKKRIAVSVLVVLMLLLTFGLGYWTGFSHAQKAPRVIVAMDTADSQQSSGKAGRFSTALHNSPHKNSTPFRRTRTEN